MLISYYLPPTILTNEELSLKYNDWSSDKIYEKTGIKSRHIATDESVADMAVNSAKSLFDEYNIDPSVIDFVILATQTPDYLLPTTACIVQDRLGIKTSVGALDINLGCSAYVYGLSLSKALLENGTAKNILLIMSEKYSKHINPMDKSTRTIFGDAAAATLINVRDIHNIGRFVFGTDGAGYDKLIIPAGGGKIDNDESTRIENQDSSGNIRSMNDIFMDGAEIFNFTIKVVPPTIKEVLIKNNINFEDIDLFVFHQANKFMLDYLKKIIHIPDNKFYVNIEDIGNTVSPTIPIALKRAEQDKRLKDGDNILLIGFGVGLSWSATIIKYYNGGIND